jgi:predicted MFS family arabinose efflux permease
MAETPNLERKIPWYQGLSRAHWWVLIVASMGWMFDTMDQQFFNLGRGPAMLQVLGYDPIVPGLEKLGENAKETYAPGDLDALVADGLLNESQRAKLLTSPTGKTKPFATRKDVAKAVGRDTLTPTFIKLGEPLLPEKLGAVRLARMYGTQKLDDAGVDQPTLDQASLQALGEAGKLDLSVIAEVIEREGLDASDSATVSRHDMALYIGKTQFAQHGAYDTTELESLQKAGLLTAEQVGKLQEGGGPAAKEAVLRAVGASIAESRDTFDKSELDDLIVLEALTKGAVKELVEYNEPNPVPEQQVVRYLGEQSAKTQADKEGDWATTIFVFGWAFGGLFFGWVGDSLGRAKTMALTILTYAVFTGLNGLAQSPLQFHILRFMTALGVGGEFAAGAALVAESMPERSRAAALGTLQALSAVGNMAGAALAYFILPISWRWLFFVGALPGIVAVFVFLKLREPEKWREARHKWLEEKKAGITKKRSSYLGMLEDPRWRKRAIIGLLLGVVGVGGLWGVGFFTPELNRMIAKAYSEEAKEKFVSVAFFLQQLGAFFGISAYTWISLKMGRRPAFGVFFALAFVIVSYTFLFANTIREAYILAPLVGFVTLGPFGGYAIYFPELFPTRLRSTGVGFCYNVGRFLAALVPSIKSGLKGLLMSGALVLPLLPPVAGSAERAIRYGSFLMIFIYVVGLVVLLFAPETKDQPLPED